MNLGRVAYILATFAMLLSGTLTLPLASALLGGETDSFYAFAWVALVGMPLAWIVRRATRTSPEVIHRRDAIFIVPMMWVIATVMGGLPFYFAGAVPTVVDGIFEAMSGFTTTGATVMTGLGYLDRSILFWRSLTHWLGGIGIVVLFVAILPVLGSGGRLLFNFETAGVAKEDLRPRIQDTARLILKIYLSLTVGTILALVACGVGAFDATIHAFGAVSTGGFSSHDASVAYYSSSIIHIILIIVMVLAGSNFNLVMHWKQHGVRAVLADTEWRAYMGVLLSAFILAWVTLVVSGTYDNVGLAARDAAFQVVSMGTSTGYATADFDLWPDALRLLLIALTFVGACAGSTAGGLKIVRIVLLGKIIAQEVRRFLRPHRVSSIAIDGGIVPPESVRAVLVMFTLWMGVWAGSSVVLSLLGMDLVSASSGAASMLGNAGPGLASVGPATTYADTPGAAKLLMTLLMLFGRLEIMAVFVIFSPSLYRD